MSSRPSVQKHNRKGGGGGGEGGRGVVVVLCYPPCHFDIRLEYGRAMNTVSLHDR